MRRFFMPNDCKFAEQDVNTTITGMHAFEGSLLQCCQMNIQKVRLIYISFSYSFYF